MSRIRPTQPIGLYDPAYEHDACGVALVAKLRGEASHETIERAVRALENLEHRGAAGADPNTGDGAGLLTQLPDEFFRGEFEDLPAAGSYGIGVCFFPREPGRAAELQRIVENAVEGEGQRVLGWRDVPVDDRHVGETAGAFAPEIRQIAVGAADGLDQDAFERKLYVIRRVAELTAGPDLVVPSFSSRTAIWKGMLMAPQVPNYFPDLRDPRVKSKLVLVHSRFSTNTFPSWELAHPYRMIAHNGEINTLRGNVNWMRARESQLASRLFGDDLKKVLPVIRPGGSDSATFDNVLELLVLSGRSIAHAMMMMIPEAYERHEDLSEELKGFYAYHGCLIEPWDGPAAVAFTDGRVIGATLDRNGLRPGRWLETKDGWVVLASETGVLDIPARDVVRKGRLAPGKLFLVDVERGQIVEDDEVKREVSTRRPYGEWYARAAVHIKDLPKKPASVPAGAPLRQLQLLFGYTHEDMKVLLTPLAANAEEAVGSMGNDTPIAVLSSRSRLLYSYFKQLFAQVTNPPIDPIREELVMSLVSMIGPRPNLLGRQAGTHKRLEVAQPVLTNADLEKIRSIAELLDGAFRTKTLDATWPAADGAAGLERALEKLCYGATDAVLADINILILSDRAVGRDRVAIPAALATAAVHHHLIRQGLRMQTGLVIETGEAREVHHFCVLAGYGAEAVNPYLALETLEDLRVRNGSALKPYEVSKNYIKAIGKGV